MKKLTYPALGDMDDGMLSHVIDLVTLSEVGNEEATSRLRKLLGQEEGWPKTMADTYTAHQEAYGLMSPHEQDRFDRAVEQATECYPIPAQLNATKVLANGLRYYRLEAGMTQQAVADAAGISLRRYQSYEYDERDIAQAAAVTVARIAQALGMTVEELLHQ